MIKKSNPNVIDGVFYVNEKPVLGRKIAWIENVAGDYAVTSWGEVISYNDPESPKGYFMSKQIGKGGYEQVPLPILKEDGRKHFKTHYVHILVGKAFLNYEPLSRNDAGEFLVVNHKDENKANNNVDNLEIVTKSYNARYNGSSQKGAFKRKGKNLKKWPIYLMSMEGERLMRFENYTMAAEYILRMKIENGENVDFSYIKIKNTAKLISLCCRDPFNHQTAIGYRWSYDLDKDIIVTEEREPVAE